MIYVTHDQVEAMTMADRIVVMDRGRIRQIGAPMDLYDRPADRFVAGFIGSPAMNFLAATGHREGLELTGTRTVLALPADCRRAPPGEALEAGIRSEHCGLAAPGAGRLAARVRLIERLGNHALVHVETDAGPMTLQAPGRTGVTIGEAVGVQLDAGQLHVFDAAGQRL